MSVVIENYFYNILPQILALIVPLITTPYITRVLGAEGLGRYSYSFSVMSYFSIFILLGLNNYGNREIAQHRKNREELSETFWNIYATQFVLGGIVSCVYLAYCLLYTSDSQLSWIFFINILATVIDVNWALCGLEEFKLIAYRNASLKVVTAILIFILIKEKKDLWVYCLILSTSSLISQFFCWPIVFKNIKFAKPKWEKIYKHIAPSLIFFATIISISVFKVMDKIMLGLLTNKVEVGLYEASERIIQIPTILVTSLGNVMMPHISRQITLGNQRIKETIRRSLFFSMFVSSSICMGIMGISQEFVPFFYGTGFEKCSVLYLILLPSCIFMAFANVIRTQYMIPYHLERLFLISGILGAIVNFSCNFLLIPKFESVGAAIGTLVAEIAICIYQAFCVREHIDIKKYIIMSFPFWVSGMMMFIIIYKFINFDSLGSIIVIGIKIIIGFVIYFCILYLMYKIRRLYRIHNDEFVNTIQEFICFIKRYKVEHKKP